MNVEIVPARLAHIEPLLERLRYREAMAFEQSGLDPFRTIEREMAYSHMTFTGLVDRQVAVIVGLHAENVLSDVAYIWMLGTDLVEAHPLAFFRHTQRFIADMHRNYRTLYCLSDASFWESHRWLQWLGFKSTGSWNGTIMFRT